MQLSVSIIIYFKKYFRNWQEGVWDEVKENTEMGMLKDERLKDENHTTSLTSDGDELHPVPSGPPSSTRQGQTP
ncbi:MAG TPA: hypothetical protein OIM03_03345 [Veillonellaceae bacterium]|nr:hypothetical protein [Veillonellaceae bacterium]